MAWVLRGADLPRQILPGATVDRVVMTSSGVSWTVALVSESLLPPPRDTSGDWYLKAS